MASAAGLAIKLSSSGQAGIEKMFDGVVKGIAGVGKAAAGAPRAALAGLGGALGDVAKQATAFALGGAITELPGKLIEMAKGAAADEQATARLGQTIRNLGGDFEAISGQVDDAIVAGQRLAFGDDDVRDSFQALAVATGDAEEALRRQKTAMDLARGANIPLATATKMLSKVNAENVEAFRRLGITIGENATEADALAAVQAKYAGQAETYAASTAGQFEAAQLAMGEIQESIGSALLPLFTVLATTLAEMLPVIQDWVGGFAGGISETLMPALQPLLDMLPDIGTALGQAFAFFTTGGGDIEMFRGVLNALIGPDGAQGVIEVFTNLTGFVHATVIPMFESFGAIVGKVLAGDFGGAIQAAGAHIARFGPELVRTLLDWGQRFVSWVAPMIPPLLAELAKLGGQVLAWIAAEGPPLAKRFITEWVPAAINWLLQAAIDIGSKLGPFLSTVLDWVVAEGPPLAKRFITEWVPAVIGWLVEAGKQIAPKLWEFLIAIDKWIREEGQPKLQQFMVKLGWAIIDGIVEGVKAVGYKVGGAITDAANAAIAEAKRQLGIRSPSKITRDELGIPLAQGIIDGIEVTGPALDNALSGVLGEATKEAQRDAVRLGRSLTEMLGGNALARAVRGADSLADSLGDVALRIGDINQLLPTLTNGLIGLPRIPGGGGGGWGLFPTPGAASSGASGSPTINANVTIDARGMSTQQATTVVTDGLVGAARKLVTGRSF